MSLFQLYPYFVQPTFLDSTAIQCLVNEHCYLNLWAKNKLGENKWWGQTQPTKVFLKWRWHFFTITFYTKYPFVFQSYFKGRQNYRWWCVCISVKRQRFPTLSVWCVDIKKQHNWFWFMFRTLCWHISSIYVSNQHVKIDFIIFTF